MRTKKLLPYCLAALLAGCVPIVSLHPLFTRGTIAFEEKLLGTWIEDGNQPQVTWEFTHLEPSAARLLPAELHDSLDKCYHLNIADDEGRKGSFAVCLVKLQDKLFLDIMPDRFPSGEQDPNQMKLVYNAFFFTPVHTFVRVSSLGEQLKIRLTDDEGFKKLIQADLKAVKYDVIDDRPVLTVSPEELQAFVAKYADDERLFPSEVTLTRKSK
jgi:hypothetical protein